MSYALTGEFTVKEARNRGTKPNPHGGELVKWYVDFLDATGAPVRNQAGEPSDCYWQRKPGSDVTPGDTVYGVIEEGQHGLRFKKEKRPDAEVRTGSAGSQNAGGGKGWEPESVRDPERSARILRQHSQGLAVQVLTAMGSFDSKHGDTIHNLIKTWTDYFDKDVNAAGEAAKQASGIAAPQGKEGAAPLPASASPASASQPADDTHQFLCTVIETAGLPSYPASKLADFVLSKLNPEQRKRAETGLSDLDTAGETLAKLKTAYEQAEGPLPTEDPADTIPF